MKPLAGDERLRGWVLLDELVQEIYRVTRRFPEDEREGLVRSLRQSAVAAAVRIASSEGQGTERAAAAPRRASVRLAELRYYLYLARRLRLLDAVTYRAVTTRLDRVSRIVERLHPGGRGPTGAESTAS
jgi:four helix bundle protein